MAQRCGNSNPDALKILILSTPKTGNTWTEALLSAIYNLPIVQLKANWDGAMYHFDHNEANALGARWVAHHHLSCEPDIVQWADDNGVALVTTMRNPADTLVSLYHYARNYADSGSFPQILPFVSSTSDMYDRDPRRAEQARNEVATYVRQDFHYQLNISISWIRSGRTRAVRYEDLWHDPVQAVTTLTSHIAEASTDSIARAIDQCEIGLMRRTAGKDSKFFRRGGNGSWLTELPDEIVEILRTKDPYPDQFALLGYGLDPSDPSYDMAPKPRISLNPFRALTHFKDGTPISPLLIRCYLSIDSAFSRRWSTAADSTAPDSFYRWLNAPTDADPHRGSGLPVITNLAEYIYRIRGDIKPFFPDLFGQDRVDYVLWFLRQGQSEHAVDAAFLMPAQERLLEWAVAPSDEDQQHDGSVPALTNYALHLYRHSLDIQRAFPDVFGEHRAAYLAWFGRDAPLENALNDQCIRRIREHLSVSGSGPVPEDLSKAMPGRNV